MSRFVITITPDTAGADDTASSQTTVRVDTSTGQTRITELTVRAADGGGLAPSDLPAVDLELLIRALGTPSAIRALPITESHPDARPDVVDFAEPAPAQAARSASDEAGAGGVVAPQPGPSEVADVVDGATVPGEESAEVEVPAQRGATKRAGRKATGRAAAKRTGGRRAAGAARGGRRAASKAAPATRAEAEPAKATGAKATGAKATRAKATRAKATRAKATRAKAAPATAPRAKAAPAKAASRGRRAAGEEAPRAYRRMPEASEVLGAYAQAGSITALAEHYGVPRHTANGWARRLRGMGYAIGRS